MDPKGGVHDLFGDGVLIHGGYRSGHKIEGMTRIPELLDGQVTLEVECLDQLYLNGYIGPLTTRLGW